MQKFTYPQSDLDNGTALLRVLGSFWASTFTGRDQLRSYTAGIATGAAQIQRNLLETVASLSRFEVPIFHTENWYPVILRKSQVNLTAANNYKFDTDNLQFGTSPAITFNALASRDFYAFAAPAQLADAAHMFDRLLFPTFALTGGVDFLVDTEDQVIVFTQNPFDNENVIRYPVYVDDVLTDEEITLWAFKADFDYQYVFRQFAYALGIRLKSSETSKAFVNAIFDGLLAGGASAGVFEAALSAVLDVPLVKEDGEVVEVAEIDSTGLLIVTSKHVYRFSRAALALVTVGQVLNAGDRLVDVLEIIDLNRGEVPDNLTALALDQGLTAACYYSDLIFENRDVPLRVNSDHPSGYTYVDFPLAGFPADVRQFFDEMHIRGIAQIEPPPPECETANKRRTGTLAHILDRRTKPMGEPVADDLPATINPLKFLVANVLRHHTFIAIIRVSGLGENHLGLYNIRHIRQLLPPYAGVFILYNLDGKSDVISGEFDVQAIVTQFKGAQPLSESVAANLVTDRGVIVRTISGTCQ
jgi:hypothetical protein